MVSPFTFYRGAAKIMAADLKDTPTAGLNVQLCGDAHLSNFGGVRVDRSGRLLFDLNDFDETLPGPFEYDVKRMAASFTIAARNNGFTTADTGRDARLGAGLPGGHGRVRRDGHHGDLVRPPVGGGPHGRHAGRWPARGRTKRKPKRPSRARRSPSKTAKKAHTRDSLQALSKLGELVDGRYRIVSQPPVVVPRGTWPAMYGLSRPTRSRTPIHEQFRAYRATLQDDRRHLLERFEVDRRGPKGGGVGSVGTRAFIVLLQGRDEQGPAVPAGQGGHRLGARGPPAQEPVHASPASGWCRASG